MMDLEYERQLVEKAKSDNEAFAMLYDHYFPHIFGYVQRRTAGIKIAQDITSEVFFKAVSNIGQFQWRGISFSSWLFRIANNEIVNGARKRKGRLLNLEEVFSPRDIENIPGDLSAEDELIEAEAELQRYHEYLALHGNVSRLSIKYQEVITLRFFENKPIKEIGEILGKREGTVKSLIHRGLKQLRTMME